MSKNLNEIIAKAVKEKGNDKITIITEKLKIKGRFPEDGEKYSDCCVLLRNAEVYKFKEKCNGDECNYSPEPMAVFSSLNIASSYIVGFGFCGNSASDET